MKTNFPPSSRRSRSLSEMEHMIKTCMTDMNCTYSLVPLKSITNNQHHQHCQSPSMKWNDENINKTNNNNNINKTNNNNNSNNSPLVFVRPKTADFRELNLVKNGNVNLKLNKNERPNILDLKPFDFSYPATPPSMIITPISTLPNSRDSLPLATNSSDLVATVASVNSEQPYSPDLMSSSLYEEANPSPSVPEHSFTLPRSVKFTEQIFGEENALERLARSFDRKVGDKHNNVELKQRKDNLESKYRSSSLSPRTARKRFLFHSPDNGTIDNPSVIVGRRLMKHGSPQPSKASSHSSQFSSTSSNNNIQDNHQKAPRAIKRKEMEHKETRRTKDKSGPSIPSILPATSDGSSTSNELFSNNSNRSNKWLSKFIDPFKRLKKSSSSKSSRSSSPQLSSDKQKDVSSCRSLTPPARFFRETKPKKRATKKSDGGSLPSLVQLSCLPSN